MDIEKVPLVAHEAQAERYTRIIIALAVSWCITILIMVFAFVCVASFESETVEEATTETTEISQDADNEGINYFAGGDINGGFADSEEN